MLKVDDAKKIQEFWDWFSANELRIYNTLINKSNDTSNNPQSTPALDALSNRMKRANSNITYEFFLVQDEKYKFEFYLSPNGNKETFQFAIDMAKAAPPSTQFIVYPFKQAHKNANELKTMGLGYGGKKIGIKDIYFRIEDEGNSKLSLDLFFKEYDGDKDQAMEIMFYLLDKVIGEYYVTTMIGGIGIYKLLNKSHLLPLYELPAILEPYKTTYGIPTVEQLMRS